MEKKVAVGGKRRVLVAMIFATMLIVVLWRVFGSWQSQMDEIAEISIDLSQNRTTDSESSEKESPSTDGLIAGHDIQMKGVANLFHYREDYVWPEDTVENEFLNVGNGLYAIYDWGSLSTIRGYGFDRDKGLTGKLLFERDDARFPYIYQEGENYCFLSSDRESIFFRKTKLLKTLGGVEKKEILNGPQNGYDYMYNAALTQLDDKYMLLVESCNELDQSDVRLSTWLSDDLDFNDDEVKDTYIPGGGNPCILKIDDDRIIVFHGTLDKGIWKLNASVWNQNHWKTIEDEKFSISEPGIHICDPAVMSVDDELIFSFSYDQKYTFACEVNTSAEQLYDKLVD